MSFHLQPTQLTLKPEYLITLATYLMFRREGPIQMFDGILSNMFLMTW